jgi:Tetratricopeptide repeat
MDNAPSLNELGILNGTDKSSLGHGYLRHYERLFRDYRHEAINVLEIGVDRGASLRMWSEYFSRATVIGVDIQPNCMRHAGERRVVEIGSQADPQFLRKIAALYRPSIVIDDGSHRADHIVFTFEHLFPTLPHGSCYVVEDMHFHSGSGAVHHRGDAQKPPQDYFLKLARLISCPDQNEIFDRTISVLTDSVEFFYGGIAIKRKADRSSDPIGEHRPLVERANQPRMWANFSQLVRNNGGDPLEAVAACRHAVELEPTEPSLYLFLSGALEYDGDLQGAIDACREAVRLHPTFEMFRTRLAQLEEKIA